MCIEVHDNTFYAKYLIQVRYKRRLVFDRRSRTLYTCKVGSQRHLDEQPTPRFNAEARLQ